MLVRLGVFAGVLARVRWRWGMNQVTMIVRLGVFAGVLARVFAGVLALGCKPGDYDWWPAPR